MTKLNLGSGDSQFEGFISVDKYDDTADVKADLADLPFDDNSVDEIVCFQTVEHIPYHQTQKMFMEMHRVLKPGCKAHIECPDLLYAAKAIAESGDIDQKWLQHIYGEYHRPWDVNRYGPEAVFLPGAIHYTGFTFKKMQRICEPMGFRVVESARRHMDVPETLSVDLIKEGEQNVELDSYIRR